MLANGLYGTNKRRRFRLLCFEPATASVGRWRCCWWSCVMLHVCSSPSKSRQQLTQKRKPHCWLVHWPNSIWDAVRCFHLVTRDAGVTSEWWLSTLMPNTPESSKLDQSAAVGVWKGIGQDWCLARAPRLGVRIVSCPMALRNNGVDLVWPDSGVIVADDDACASFSVRSTMLLPLHLGHFISLWDLVMVLTIYFAQI